MPASKTVKIAVSSKSRGITMPIAELVLNTGTYAWDIPEDFPLADDYCLSLVLNDEPSAGRKPCSDVSRPFGIILSASQQRQAKGVDSLRR